MSRIKRGKAQDTLETNGGDLSPSDEEKKFEIEEHKESNQLVSDPDDVLSEEERKRIVCLR